jgi:ferritin-like metal-binding protein YciE
MKTQLLNRLTELQKHISQTDGYIKERDRILVELHQVHHVKQADLAQHLSSAAAEVGGTGVSDNGVFKAICRTMGRTPGKVHKS